MLPCTLGRADAKGWHCCRTTQRATRTPTPTKRPTTLEPIGCDGYRSRDSPRARSCPCPVPPRSTLGAEPGGCLTAASGCCACPSQRTFSTSDRRPFSSNSLNAAFRALFSSCKEASRSFSAAVRASAASRSALAASAASRAACSPASTASRCGYWLGGGNSRATRSAASRSTRARSVSGVRPACLTCSACSRACRSRSTCCGASARPRAAASRNCCTFRNFSARSCARTIWRIFANRSRARSALFNSYGRISSNC